MNLSQIITANENPGYSIEIGQIVPYKKSLLTVFGCDAFLMVTGIFNACSYGRIVSVGDGFSESIEEYVNTIPDLTDQEKTDQIELINFQSIMLKDL